MTIELVSARSKIKQFIKHMPDGSDKDYLNKIQKDLKSYINNNREKEVTVNKVYGNLKIAIWSIEQNFLSKNLVLVLEYEKEKELYTFNWTYGSTNALSFRHSEELNYQELKQLITKVFNEEFLEYAKY